MWKVRIRHVRVLNTSMRICPNSIGNEKLGRFFSREVMCSEASCKEINFVKWEEVEVVRPVMKL